MSMDAQNVVVIGAGTMGNGIAHVFAQSGHTVTLVDVNAAALERATETIGRNLDRLVAKARITAQIKADTLDRLTTSTEMHGAVSNADLVVEAATERVDLKLQIFEQLDKAAPAHAILATNTSSISITKIAAVTQRASQVIGMHFMNPVPIMKLVEIINGKETSDATNASVIEASETMGKTALSCNDAPGFVSNRILCPMLNEAVLTLQEGVAQPEAIDGIMKLGMNHPIGPLALPISPRRPIPGSPCCAM